jgi:CRISPR-associated protein Cmr2
MSNDDFWKMKLAAYLHDPPCKCFNIHEHEKIAEGFRGEAGITPDDYATFDKEFDHVAAAADRFPFPSRVCTARFTGGEDFPFIHPLSDAKLSFSVPVETAELAEGKFQDAIGSVDIGTEWKRKFFLYWRCWSEQAAKSDARLMYLPAETRMPDHTIWNHMALTSAMVDANAFLIFQLGGIQDFIAQARTTRDMWAGSYLLSHLMALALRAVADECGPDSVIFPNLRGLPIFDLQCKDIYGEFYKQFKYGKHDENMPVIPNRFCGIIPAERGQQIAEKVEEALRGGLAQIGDEVWSQLPGAKPEWKARWDRQLELFPQISWQIMPWEKDCFNCENLKNLEELTNKVEVDQRDKQNYPLNLGFYWQANFARCEAALAARRNLRDFQQLDDQNAAGCPKDTLSGKEEIIGNEDWWKSISGDGKDFTEKEKFGAMNIVKRLWKKDYARVDLEAIAKKNVNADSPYIAVLKLDGDKMGKILSGEESPKLTDQMAGKATGYFQNLGASDVKRALSPSYHLQFSEALANFALHIAWRVVKAFKGQLIYSGGDDVLAILPADRVLACAAVLRSCFRGEPCELLKESRMAVWRGGDELPFIFEKGKGGWITPIIKGKETYPLMMPGNKCDVSCGIAVARYSHPLQHIVREANKAEQRAKNKNKKEDGGYDRKAFAMSLLKHSGETIHWGAKWDSGAIELFYQYCELRKGDKISNRFPYKLAELLAPYRLEKDKKLPQEIIRLEMEHAIKHSANEKGVSLQYDEYLGHCAEKPDDFPKLFLTAAFIERKRGEGE